MAVEGTLDLFQLPEILQVVSQQRKTGILTIQGTDDIVAVSFLEGDIVAADSLTETTEEGVGEVLIDKGLLDGSDLRELTSRSVQGGPRLGDLLVAKGHVDRSQFLDALREHTLTLLMGLLEWRIGEFKFYGGDEVSYEDGFRAIGVDELLLRSIEEGEQTERESLPAPDSRLRAEEMDRPVQVRRVDELGDEPTPVVDDDVIWVSAEEDHVLQWVAPKLTVEEVAQAAGVPLDRTRYVLYRLSRAGLVGPSIEPPSEDPPETGPGLEPAPEPGPESSEPADELPPAEAPGPSPAAAPPEAPARAARPHPPRRVRASAGIRGLPITILLALVLAAIVLGAMALAPAEMLRPFPWLAGERAEFDAARAETQRLQIDRAAKTFFLLQGRFPDRLQELVDFGILQSDDLIDPGGQVLSYRPRGASYEVGPLASTDAALAAAGAREGIAGNFLLDLDFGGPVEGGQPDEPPLVLLD